MKRAVAVAVVLVVLTAFEVTVVAPGWFGLAGYLPWAQLVSLRGLIGVAAAGSGILALAGWGVSRPVTRDHRRQQDRGRQRQRDRRRPSDRRRPRTRGRSAGRLLLAGSALLQLAVLVAEFGVVGVRGYSTDPLPRDPHAPRASAAGPAELTVVVANTMLGRADPQPLAELAARVGADVVSLPEAGTGEGGRVRAALGDRGITVAGFTTPQVGVVSPTTLLVSDRLGSYAEVAQSDGGPGAVTVGPVGHAGPLIAVAHPFPPLGRRRTATWRALARRAVDVCRSAPDVVLAGDFNATVDHPALQDLAPCVDAASQRGAAAYGTWPDSIPPVLGGALDHVLVTAARWRVVSYSVAPIPGSDHRAVVVRLQRR